MKRSKQWALTVLATLMPLDGHALAQVQDKYPSKSVTIIVPQAAGGANDAIARIIAQKLSEQTGQSFRTPKAIVAQLNADIAKALEAKEVQERLAVVGCEPYKTTSEQFTGLIKSDLGRWAGIVKASGASVD